MKKTILISGVKGFLAGYLVNLLKTNYTIYGIGREAENWNGIEVFSSHEIARLSINPDFIVACHAAVSSGQTTQSSELLFNVNVRITEQLLEKFTASKIIYISSVSIYDPTTKVITENSPMLPKSAYAISKFWGEHVVLKSKHGVVLRLSSLYGPGMKENTIIPNYTNQALKTNSIEVWGNGERKQNYINVNDACNCIKSIIENFDAVASRILLGVAMEEYSNSDLARSVALQTNATIVNKNEDNAPSLHYNNAATRSILGWSPQIKFNNGISNYIQWKKEQF